jgi:DNA helicase-2/ATP-dependent DNA helicase PcrA
MDYLAGLNPEQRTAAMHGDGPMLVIAGAGTGKTQVITRRIARLIASDKAKPEQILALTFTEKAAQEMQDRLFDLVGYNAFSASVLTFNAFGGQLLQRYASHVGRAVGGGLINDMQKTLLLQQHIERIEFQYYGLQADLYSLLESIVHYISRLQNLRVSVDEYTEFVQNLQATPEGLHEADIKEQQDLAALYRLYETLKCESGVYDYHDQLAVPLEILEGHPNLVERLRKEFRYILVDEYQDTSPIQDALLRLMAPKDGNLFAVGDDDQAIYSFRGASLENILDFTTHFKVTAPIVLVQNYRSGQPILDAAYRLIKHNDPARLESKLGLTKRLIAQTQVAVAEFTPFVTVADEQAAVISGIQSAIKGGTLSSQIAILARSNATLRSYAKGLKSAGVAYSISTEVNIFEQREVIQLWYALQWIGQRATDDAIGHIIMGPLFNWSSRDWGEVVEVMRSELITLEVALRKMATDNVKSQQLLKTIELWRSWASEATVSELVVKIITQETGDQPSLLESLQHRAQTENHQERRIISVFEDLHKWLEHMQDFETVSDDKSLIGYLASFPVQPTIEVAESSGDELGVQLLTVHASKGLEFETVYLVNCTSRAWSPSVSSGIQLPELLRKVDILPHEHEERRLLYVAVTRAKSIIHVSSPTASSGGMRQRISPLMEELFGELPSIEQVERVSDVAYSMQKIQRFYPLAQEMPDHLPFETADGWLEMGVNDLSRFETLPHDFYLQNVLKISQPFGPQLAFGVVVHGAIQAYYESLLRAENLTIDSLLERIDQNWSERGYSSKAMSEMARKRAGDTIRRFVTRDQDSVHQIEATELPIRLEIPEAKLRLRGRIDATFRAPNGLEIRDFKTGNKSDPEKLAKDARDSFQLRCYALAIEQLTGKRPGLVTLDYVVTGVEGSAELSDAIYKNFRTKLVALAGKLRARDFHPGAPSLFNQSAAFKYYGVEDDNA